MKILKRSDFNLLKNKCTNYHDVKELMIACLNEKYIINYKMFNELMVLLKKYEL